MKNKTLNQSFKAAFRGFCRALSSERNLRIHIVAALLVAVAGFVLRIDSLRWSLLALAAGLVFVSELLNTAIEKLTDMVTGEYSEQARDVKDISASAVLACAVLSAAVGALVFFEPLMLFVKKL